jgi:hypothetical protein
MHEPVIIFSNPQLAIELAAVDGAWHPFGEAASANFVSLYPSVWDRMPDRVLWTIVWSSDADGNPNAVALSLIYGDGTNVLGPQIRRTDAFFGPEGLDVSEWFAGSVNLSTDHVQIGQHGVSSGARSPKLYQSRVSLLWDDYVSS